MSEPTTQAVREALQELLDHAASDVADQLTYETGNLLDHADSSSYELEGVMTSDEGLVLRLADGAEFQITVVRSG